MVINKQNCSVFVSIECVLNRKLKVIWNFHKTNHTFGVRLLGKNHMNFQIQMKQLK